jgi:hypothetical protein
VPAGIALVLTVTFHFSFAYSANAFRAASWMNFETGVISVSSGADREGDDERDEQDQRDRMSHAGLSFSQWRARSTARRQPS